MAPKLGAMRFAQTFLGPNGSLRRGRSALLGIALLAAACEPVSTAPSVELLRGQPTDSLYERIITRIDDSGLPLPTNDGPGYVADTLRPGDVVQISYYLTPTDGTTIYRVNPGDILSVEVAGHPDLANERAIVAPDGSLSLSLVGPIKASGETIDDLTSRIRLLYTLENIRNPRVSVGIVERTSRAKELIEQLLRPGTGGVITITVLEDLRIQVPLIGSVDLNRPIGEVREIVRRGYRERFGDELEVVVNVRERAPRSVYVLGEVQEANAVELAEGMTPLMAVAAAGGLTKEADAKRIVLIRFDEQRNYQYWLLNMKDGLTDINYQGNYVHLRPNDIVFVPLSAIDEVNLFIEKFVKEGLPTSLQAQLGLRPGNNFAGPTRTVVLPRPAP